MTNTCFATSDTLEVVFKDSFYPNDTTLLSFSCLKMDAYNYLFKVCKVDASVNHHDTCQTLSEDKKLGQDLQKGYFFNSINELVNKVAPNVDTTKPSYKDQLKKLYTACYNKINKKPSPEDERIKEIKDAVSSLLVKLENDESSAVTISLKDKIHFYTLSKTKKKEIGKEQKDSTIETKNSYFLQVINAQLVFANTTLDQIDIEWLKNGIRQPTISNPNHSINIRSLIDGNASIKFDDIDGTHYKLYYRDVFQVTPVNDSNQKGAINYYPKNGSYNLKPAANKVNVTRRNFSDYFYANIFLDPFGVSDNKPNKFIQTDFNLEVPIVYRNRGRWSFFNYLQVRASLGADMGNFRGNDKFLQAFPDTINRVTAGYITSDTLPTSKNRYVVNNFDLLRYNWLHTYIKTDILSLYFKEANTRIFLETGVDAWVTTIEKKFKNIIDTDTSNSSVKTNVFSFSPEFNLKFQFTPDIPFGANLNFTFMPWFDLQDESFTAVYGKNITPAIQKDSKTAKQNSSFLRVEFNAYFKTNSASKSNDGVFTRIQYNKNLGNINTSFLILVGYSTNISSLIKNK